MMVIRPAASGDLNGIYTLATTASDGITTLPVSKERLLYRIRRSESSFALNIKKPYNEYYFFVLEDTDTGRIVGTTAVFGAVGLNRPFYNYKIKQEIHACSDPEVRAEIHSLHFGNHYKGATELATLFLHPDYRHGGNGTLLSKSRFLLIAGNPKRFSTRIMAEIRGWVDAEGNSPFWDAIGKTFFKMKLVSADRINSLGNYKFIEDLMPKHPIYMELMPKEAREVIQKPHDESAPALRLLESEGMKVKNCIDIFDGGPCIEAKVSEIRAIRESKTAKLDVVPAKDCTGRYLISNPALNSFRCLQGGIREQGKGVVGVTAETAEALLVKKGGKIRYVTLKRESV